MAALDALTGGTPCSLVAHVNGEQIKVAIGSIICLKDAIMHEVQMSEGAFKVELYVVLNGYEDIAPPIQPPGVDSQLSLGQCLCWPMMWPKSQIWLGDVQIPTSSKKMNKTSCRGPSPLGQSQPDLHKNNVDVVEDQVSNDDDLLVNRFFLIQEYQNTSADLDGPMPADPVQAFSMPPADQAIHRLFLARRVYYSTGTSRHQTHKCHHPGECCRVQTHSM